MLYHRGWCRAVETALTGLTATLLIRHPDTRQLFVNFDPHILELIQEAKYLKKLNLEIPHSAILLCKKEDQIKDYRVR